MQRVVDLTKQLDTAQKTINSLETINVGATHRQIKQTDAPRLPFFGQLVNSTLNSLYSSVYYKPKILQAYNISL